MSADPFEVRVKFSNQLQHLNASVNSAQKAAYYALKYKDMDEDLHSCILEQLERNNTNTRANILYFITTLCDVARREPDPHHEFIRMIQRDIGQIVDAVAPPDGSGAANIKVVRRVLDGLQTKDVLSAETVKELEVLLGEREGDMDVGESDTAGEAGEEGGIGKKGADGVVLEPASVGTGTRTTSGIASNNRPDKRQIEQRIEEDRERHKRLRESIWAVSAEGDAEFEKLWDDTSDIGEDDFLVAGEDALERKRAMIHG